MGDAAENSHRAQDNDPGATWQALGAASRERADAFLNEQAKLVREQTELARLQADDLRREDSLRHWSLRVHHVSDVMKLAFELSIALILIAIVVAIGSAVWNAANDSGLVIESFSVPPDMAARGLTGQVVAAQLQDRLVAMQNATNSARPAASYSSNWGKDIKVEIPNTGVSIGEAYRYLAGWLGNETHISGEVYRAGGGIAVTARAGGDGGSTVRGADTDLDKLLQQVAEKIYLHTQPYRYAIYINALGPSRQAESRAVLQGLAVSGSPRDRAWAYIGLGNLDKVANQPSRSIDDFHQVLALAPNFALAYINLDQDESTVGHDEASLAAAREAVRLLQGNADVEMSDRARAVSLVQEQANVAYAQNDFAAGRAFSERVMALPDYDGSIDAARTAIPVALALEHDVAAARHAFHELPPPVNDNQTGNRNGTESQLDYWLGDWRAVVVKEASLEAFFRKSLVGQGAAPGFVDSILSVQAWPYVAGAMAFSGDLRGAQALIAKTPLDCYACLRNRAQIAAVAHDWQGADRWFDRATRHSPSIPIGWSQWGAMLLARGDLSGAIAKFQIANQKGPHFADPLELWGEALIAQNRSDLALAKFEDAARYAPNWGRLHLKWGEALGYIGRKDEARAQYRVASTLTLSVADTAELARDVRS
jgi:tetratricopeptide (TPR) repeat protein